MTTIRCQKRTKGQMPKESMKNEKEATIKNA